MKTMLTLALLIVILMINGCAPLVTATSIPSDTSAPTVVPAATIALAPTLTFMPSDTSAPTVVPTTAIVPTSTFTPTPTTTPITIIPIDEFIEPQLDQEFWIKIGESVTLEKGSLTIKFISLTGDSRCPEGVICAWMGNAEVILEVSKNEITLNTLLDPNEEVVGDYNIQLRDVIPYPKAGVEYMPENYSIKIVVSKK
jgi:hypothetical protein